MTLRIFIGFDDRQPLAYNVLQHSIVRRSSAPVAITPLVLSNLPINREGLTQFTFTRYLVPWLCDYQGVALFLDSDMLVLGDISELLTMAGDHPVSVVKNNIRFEWPSLMLFNCDKCRVLDPQFVQKYGSPQDLTWSETVGALPAEWNHCVGYDAPKPAKLAHFTQGIPHWFETSDCEYATQWREDFADMQRICSWKEIMGKSVHAKPVLERMFREYMGAAR